MTNHSKHFGRISPIPLNFDETILEHPPETQNRQPIPRNVMNWDKDPFLRLRPINELPDDVWEGPPEWFVQAEQRVREAEKAKECTTDDDFDAFPLLQVINSEYIRYRYGEIETVFAVKPRRKQQRILRDSKILAADFVLNCAAISYRFVFSPSNADISECLKRERIHIKGYLEEGHLRKTYDAFHVKISPFHGFEPFTTTADEPAYIFHILVKKSGRPFKLAAKFIMGSIGMHSLEAIFDLEGDDFAFYPFVIANGDQRILDEVFGYMYRYHDGGIRRQWFSATDMWRNMCCCLYYSDHKKPGIKRKKKNLPLYIRLTLMDIESKEETVWKVDAGALDRTIRAARVPWDRNTTLFDKKMTVAQVMEVKNFITDAYQVKFGAAWNPARTVVKEFHSHSITISHEGNLMFRGAAQAVSYLYFFGKYRTRAFIHPIYGISFEEISVPKELQDDVSALPPDWGNDGVDEDDDMALLVPSLE